MSALSQTLARLRALDPERWLGLRAPAPPVAIELDAQEALLVRLKPWRGRPLLEAHAIRPLDPGSVPSTMFNGGPIAGEALAARLGQLFEVSGTRPGRVALVLPDNLAKIALVELPERPPARAQLEQLVRFKMRRAVPFRLEEAALSYQVLPGDGPGLGVLVALVKRTTIEAYEAALLAIGARPGQVGLATPSLVNLCRAQLAEAAAGGDVALLNAARSYFSLVILRGGRLIFYRCKTLTGDDAAAAGAAGAEFLTREVAGSLSYYQEKLAGQGLAALFVRSLDPPAGEVAARLSGLGIPRVEPLAAHACFVAGERMDAEQAQRLAAAIGATGGGR